jgi:hypothetical protein
VTAQFPDGRIPFRLRVGVTGHIAADRLGDQASLRREIAKALDEVLARLRSKATPVLFRAVSPLAEGADRVVALEVLEWEGADLEVPLPSFPDGRPYTDDFDTEASRREFDDLRRRAVATYRLARAGTEDDAYESVGRWVVDRCDVLIAIWDGHSSDEQGGTAQTIDYARPRVPMIIIDAGTHERRLEGWEQLWADCEAAFHRLDGFNRGHVSASKFRSASEEAEQDLFGAAAGVDPHGHSSALASWVVGAYVRADQRAVWCRTYDVRTTAALVVLAATAVALGAFRTIYEPERSFITWIEVVVLFAVMVIYVWRTRYRIHDRWVASRDLAERLRAAPFQAVLDPRADVTLNSSDATTAGANVRGKGSWQLRAFVEVWDQRPRLRLTAPDSDWMKSLLTTGWIRPQIEFTSKSTERHAKGKKLYQRAPIVVFGLTFLATLIHAFPDTERLPEFLAIALPAVGAALHALASEREHARHSHRYDSMNRRLNELDGALARAGTLAEVRAAGREAARFITAEKAEWQDLVKQQEFELPA